MSLLSVVISYHKIALLVFLFLACLYIKCYLAQRYLATMFFQSMVVPLPSLKGQNSDACQIHVTFCLCHALKTTQGDTFIQQSSEMLSSLRVMFFTLAFHIILTDTLTDTT